jgi:hypothetical protein
MRLLSPLHLLIHTISYNRIRVPQLLHAAGTLPPRHDPGYRKVTRPARCRQGATGAAAAVMEPAAESFPPVAHRVCFGGFQGACHRAFAAGSVP